jgi:tetratricopeptide (TPR) repeat protein
MSEEQNQSYDANDYSRFDDVSDDDDDVLGATTNTDTLLTLQESLSKASILKDSGNTAFKSNQYSVAKKHYEDAVKLLDKHKSKSVSELGPEHHEAMTSILVSLHGNIGMVMLKEENWNGVIKSSTEVLTHDGDNVKALYRRSVAYHKTCRFNESKSELMRVLALDPSNTAAKKELVELNKSIKEQQQREKQAFNGMFSKGSMYEDKEQERQAKIRADEIARQKEQDDYVKSRLDRREKGLSEQTFDEWKKEKSEMEKKEKSEKEKSSKPSSSSPSSSTTTSRGPKKSPTRKSGGSAGSDDEYDAEDQKIISEVASKGYCHFRRDLPSQEKALIGDITPKSIGGTSEGASGDVTNSGDGNEGPVPMEIDGADNTKVAASTWNHAGTWEERDMTEVIKSRIREMCLSGTATLEGGFGHDMESSQKMLSDALHSIESNGTSDLSSLENLSTALATATARVTEVDKLEGEAHIVLARGKKRHI